jgi:beta-mannosidase
VTCGPYLPVYLDAYTSRIEDLYVTSNISPDHLSADISVSVKLSKAYTESSVQVQVLDALGTQVAVGETSTDGSCTFKVLKPSLWWPNGHGDQHLYTATAILSQFNDTLDTSSKKFGIRSIEVIQRPLSSEPGKTFMFNVNGRDIFAQGGDWIPADNLLPRLTQEKYYSWIKMAQRGNLNMIRVWGGGIYETDDFFDACDEMGLLVWHDYAFACGDFPVHPEFLDSVRKEVECQTLRMRGRASLALLCGGNEDFMLADWDGEPFPGTYLHK